MKKHKYIYLISCLFLVVALAKYIFIPSVFPPLYYAFEIFSFIIVLGLSYFALINFDMRSNDNICENQCEIREQLSHENKALKAKLKTLEKEKLSNQNYLSHEENFLSAIEELDPYKNPKLGKDILNLINKQFEIVAGIVYEKNSEKALYDIVGTFGIDDDWQIEAIKPGEGIHGQTINENKAIEISEIPADYFSANSGTGNAHPTYIYILPYKLNNGKAWLFEVATFKAIGIHNMWNKHLASIENKKN